MGLNKQTGNMYPFVTHTWNPIRGKCPHDCLYCYMRDFKVGEYRFEEAEMRTNLGQGNFIFVGSSTDMWLAIADWILSTLGHCRQYPLNRYLFQSKAPDKFQLYLDFLPPDYILGTTIETNRDYEVTLAPTPEARMLTMLNLPRPKMVSIEPIMDFDVDILIDWIKQIKPEFVSIGADSKGHHLPEPPADKIQSLIEALREVTTVKIKNNLNRLYKREASKDV
jgi:DNA repair photolyase